MRIINIDGKDYGCKFNIGVMKRTAKNLNMTTPQVFDNFEDISVSSEMLVQSLYACDKKFDRDIVDELGFGEFMECVDVLRKEMEDGMPETSNHAPAGVKDGKK